MEITPRAGGKADVVLQVRPGIELSSETRRKFEEIKARAAGKGRFKAEIGFDFEAFAGEQQRRADLAKRGAMVPVFSGRSIVALRQIEFVNPALIREAVRVNRPFRIPIGALGGIPVTVDPTRELMITAWSKTLCVPSILAATLELRWAPGRSEN